MTAPVSFVQRTAEVAGLMATRPLMRALNFHSTSTWGAKVLETQLEHCSRHFSTANEEELDTYLVSGQWHKPKPPMILAFYEGYRNGYDVILPLLQRYDLVGWFFVITGFVETEPEQQFSFANRHGIGLEVGEYPDDRCALSWDELREIDQSHVVACHASTHEELAPMDSATQQVEIIGSQRLFEEQLGHPVRSFVSRSGPPYGEDPAVDRLIREAGYQIVFSNYRIQKI